MSAWHLFALLKEENLKNSEKAPLKDEVCCSCSVSVSVTDHIMLTFIKVMHTYSPASGCCDRNL